jgi:hypothetical protein
LNGDAVTRRKNRRLRYGDWMESIGLGEHADAVNDDSGRAELAQSILP